MSLRGGGKSRLKNPGKKKDSLQYDSKRRRKLENRQERKGEVRVEREIGLE